MNQTECPSLERLRAGLEGSADGPALAAHVEACRRCQSRLQRLAGADESLDDWLRQAGSTPMVGPDPGPAAAAAPGDRVDEYRLEQLIGEGGMGAVWRAVHTRLDRPVALKLLGRRMNRQPDAVARFAREMKAVGRLRHPHIVAASDAGDWNGTPYLVMEFVEGTDLGRRVKKGGPLGVSDACEAVRQAALGLQHAHEHGLVHRDVKPNNLMLAADGTVKVLDLGLARVPGTAEGAPGRADGTTACAADDLTATDMLVGTAAYMAPEQKADPRTVDARADVYALGRTLCYLLTASPELPNAGTVPGGLRKVLKKLLAADPADRYPTAAAAAKALRPWARGQNLAGVARRRRAGRRAALMIGIAVGLVVATGALVALLRPRSLTVSETANAARPEPPPLGQLGMTSAEAADLQKRWAVHLGVGTTMTNGLGMKLALVPPGEFNLAPNARVRITRPYWVGTTEVTRGQFRRFVTARSYVTEVEKKMNGKYLFKIPDPKNKGYFLTRSQRDPGYSWLNPGYDGATDDHPVTMISWNDAVEFCRWLSEREGKTYRLPTRAEQEWSARAGDSGIYPGSQAEQQTFRSMEKYAWTFKNSDGRPHPVGELLPNPWGLYDVLGNADEMGADWTSPVLKEVPTGLHVDYQGPPTGTYRVIFGGGYNNRANFDNVLRKDPQDGNSEAGFRVVCEP
jgi:formylglycine-generating enzyme required for sulfatase activity